MISQGEIAEVVASCVAMMVNHHDSSLPEQSARAMAAGVQGVAGRVNGFHLRVDVLDRQILHPVEDELRARYGPAVSDEIYAAFLKAFEEGYIFNLRAADPPAGERIARRGHAR